MRSIGLSNGPENPTPEHGSWDGSGARGPGHDPRTAPQPTVGQDPRLGAAPGQQPWSQPNQNPYAQASYPAQQPGPAPDSYAQTGAADGARPARRGVGTGGLLLGMGLAALVGAGAYGAADAVAGPDSSPDGIASRELVVNDTDSVNEITGAAAKASPSVVTISSSDGQSAGSGSGVVLDEQGHILTNTHVVTMDGQAGDPSIEVQLADGTVTSAEIVGVDPLSDLAVIRIDHDGLVPAELGSSSELNVGDAAIAIGAPLGLSGTVTDGIISTTDRTIAVASSAVPEAPAEGEASDDSSSAPGGSWEDFFFDFGQGESTQGEQESVFLNVIQTDASINPGNSGGPLINSDGQVIGINVAIASAAGGDSSAGAGSIGVGFSIPIDHAQRVAQEIIETGEATHGYLGASVSPAAADDGQSQVFSEGALVREVVSGSPADEAGLREGDVIRSFNGHRTLDADELTAAVRELPAGGEGELVYERGGSERTVQVTVSDSAEA